MPLAELEAAWDSHDVLVAGVYMKARTVYSHMYISYTYTCIHIYVRAYIHACTRTCIHTNMLIYMYASTQRCTYIYIYIHTHVCVSVDIYIYTHTEHPEPLFLAPAFGT